MKIEDYSKYYIQGSDHYLIPKDVFKELFNEMSNWREESKELNQKYLNAVADYETTMSELQELQQENKILKENAENNDKVVDKVNWENMLLKKENEQLKEKNEDLELNWEIIRQYCLDEQIPEETDEYNSYIEFSNSVYDNILNKMQELEQGSDK